MVTKLFCPVGLNELALIWESGMREFRVLPHQLILYPATNIDYAREVARDWNTRHDKSEFSGFVTAFEIRTRYLSKFKKHTVGSSTHEEYWIPASEMSRFNGAIKGLIQVEEAHFGVRFKGYVPDQHVLKGKGAFAQFVAMARTSDRSSSDFTSHVSANRKAVYLNCLYWENCDFSEYRIDQQQKKLFLKSLKRAWECSRIEVPLPIRN
jgi:hypothetical protein